MGAVPDYDAEGGSTMHSAVSETISEHVGRIVDYGKEAGEFSLTVALDATGDYSAASWSWWSCSECGSDYPEHHAECPTYGRAAVPEAAPPEPRWRVGRKVGRTIYRGDTLIGVMDTPELAREAVDARNGAAPPEQAAPTEPADGPGKPRASTTGSVATSPPVSGSVDAVPDYDALAERLNEPLCDATFRARLLHQGLSNDEIAQYVEAVEAERREAAVALAALTAERAAAHDADAQADLLAATVARLSRERDDEIARLVGINVELVAERDEAREKLTAVDAEDITVGEILDGLSLWDEHKPQSGEDWIAVARRFIADGGDMSQSSPLFAALVLAVREVDSTARPERSEGRAEKAVPEIAP